MSAGSCCGNSLPSGASCTVNGEPRARTTRPRRFRQVMPSRSNCPTGPRARHDRRSPCFPRPVSWPRLRLCGWPPGDCVSSASRCRSTKRHGSSISASLATTTARLEALHRVARRAPSIALATRGGYGLTRLLDLIDWTLHRAQRRARHALGRPQRSHGAAAGPAGACQGHHLGRTRWPAMTSAARRGTRREGSAQWTR